MRILFFGDGPWATGSLRLLAGEGWKVVAVVLRTRPTDPALRATAHELGLPVLQPPDVNAPTALAAFAELQPDLNVCVSHDQIFRRAILESAPRGCVNFHAGKLPFYRGRNVINWALINGETEIGITGHYMDEGIDTGDILAQTTVPVTWTDTYADVLAKVEAALPSLVAETIACIARGDAERRPQPKEGTFFVRRGEGDEWLDWTDTSRNLYNKVRAITRPGPGARTVRDGKSVVVWRALYDPSWAAYIATPGQIVGIEPGVGVRVKTGDSTVILTEVQVEGGEVQVPRWRVGTRLGSAERVDFARDADDIRPRCVILGGGGHAHVVIESALLSGRVVPHAVLDADRRLWGSEVLGVPVRGGDEFLPEIVAAGATCFVVGVGGVGDNRPRRRLFELATAHGLVPATILHPAAVCSRWSRVGAGTVVFASAVVNASAVVGANVIVNSGAVVEHGCVVEDHVHIATGARLAADVTVGAGAHIGVGATVRQGISIGADAVVGAGAVVVRDVPAGTVVVGVPARPLHRKGESVR